LKNANHAEYNNEAEVGDGQVCFIYTAGTCP